MRDKYGPVMSVQVGRDYWVVLNDFESITEALVNQSEKFSGRVSNFINDLITKGYGIAGGDYGPEWKKLKKFGYHALRGFGFGKKSMEQNINEEAAWLIESLTSTDKKEFQTKITQAVCNIVNRLTFGTRLDYEDKRFIHMTEVTQKIFSDSREAKVVALLVMAPSLRFLPNFKQAVKDFVGDFETFLGYFEDIIADHEADFDEHDIRDYIDVFLKEMKDRGQNDPSFNKQQLAHFVRDLIDGGTGTTASTLCWVILCFANYPDHQEKIYKEILENIGESGIPSMKHQDEMPYTCAFIQEILRHRPVVPFGILHKTTEEATLNGYTIPKNTIIAPNMWAVHYDSRHFKNPKEFQPERFLDPNGKFVKPSHVISFSMGPRYCPGENLARLELFIFLTAIVQKLKVVPDNTNPLPAFESGRFNMMTYESPKFHVKFEQR
ncbi:cytochrome P450 2U1-like [Styela clava]